MVDLTCTKETEKEVIKTILLSLNESSENYEERKIIILPEYFDSSSRIPSIIWKLAAEVKEEWCPYRLTEWSVNGTGQEYVLTMQFRRVNLIDIAPTDTNRKLIGRTVCGSSRL